MAKSTSEPAPPAARSQTLAARASMRLSRAEAGRESDPSLSLRKQREQWHEQAEDRFERLASADPGDTDT